MNGATLAAPPEAPTEQGEHTFPVIEIFGPTIQGEGSLAGAVTHFVRMAFCEYSCSWCDTKYSWQNPVYEKLTAKEIVDRLAALEGRAKWVTISGGNPALQKHLGELIGYLRGRGWCTALETQGSVPQKWFEYLDHLVLSPKPPSSKMDFNADRFERCLEWAPTFSSSIKVVVFDEMDLLFAKQLHEAYPKYDFYLQVGTPPLLSPTPEAVRLANQIVAYRNLVDRVLRDPAFQDVRVLPQLHNYLWGDKRGV